jgi:hypothetical protein
MMVLVTTQRLCGFFALSQRRHDAPSRPRIIDYNADG